MGVVILSLGLSAGCQPTQVTQERATDSTTAPVALETSDTFDEDDDDAPADDDDAPPADDDDGPDETTSDTDEPTGRTASDTDDDTESGSEDTGTSGVETGSSSTGGGFWCADEDLGNAATPVSFSGNNGGGVDFLVGSCTDGVSGDEILFSWTAPEAGTYLIDTIGSEIDTVLYVLDGCGGMELVCDDDINPPDTLTSSVSLDLSAGESILIVVDGYDDEEVGNFELYISS